MCIKEKIYLAQFKHDKYLVLNTEKEKLLNYQLEMINNNKECGILEIEVKQFNSNLELNYKVVDLKSLEEYLFENEVNERKLINVIKSITNIINNHENYFLEQDNYLLEIDRIYINPVNNVIKMVYIPLEETLNEDFEGEFKKLIKELVTKSMSKNWVDTNKIGVSILNHIEKKYFDMIDFERFILSFQNSDTSSIKNNKFEVNNHKNFVNKYEEKKSVNDFSNFKSEKSTYKKPKGDLKNVDLGKNNKNSAINLVILISALISIIGIIIMFFNKNDKLQFVAQIVIFIGILGIIIAVTLSSFKNKKDSSKKSNNKIKNKNYENLIEANCCTEILGEEKIAQLISDNGKYSKKIDSTSDEFIIGRLKEEVDFCIPVKTVGKRHAKIIKETNGYYLVDINSKNGTYLNGKRLDTNKLYKLNNNDEVIFVNNRFIYKED